MKTKIFITLIMVALLTSACSAPTTSSLTQASSGSATGTQIMITNYKFDPAIVTIKTGSTITWTNQDTVVHTVVAADGSWKSPSLANGASFSYTFTAPGSYAYICGVHPSMKGTIIVQ